MGELTISAIGALVSIGLLLALYYFYIKPKKYNKVFHYFVQIILGFIGVCGILSTVFCIIPIIGLIILTIVSFSWAALGLTVLYIVLVVLIWLINVTVPFRFMQAMRRNQKEHLEKEVIEQ